MRCQYCAKHDCLTCDLKIYSLIHQSKFKNRIKKYNISESQYLGMLSKQKGMCAICKTPAEDLMLFIDHDHNCCEEGSCGACVRGLLCRHCNFALGFMKDNGTNIYNMLIYLDKEPPPKTITKEVRVYIEKEEKKNYYDSPPLNW